MHSSVTLLHVYTGNSMWYLFLEIFKKLCTIDYNVYFYMKQWPVGAAKLANPLITLSHFPDL